MIYMRHVIWRHLLVPPKLVPRVQHKLQYKDRLSWYRDIHYKDLTLLFLWWELHWSVCIHNQKESILRLWIMIVKVSCERNAHKAWINKRKKSVKISSLILPNLHIHTHQLSFKTINLKVDHHTWGHGTNYGESIAQFQILLLYILGLVCKSALQWRHNGRDSVWNHQPRECLLNRLIRWRSKKTSKVRVTGLCAENSPETGEFHEQRYSDVENVSIWWRHHDIKTVRGNMSYPGFEKKVRGQKHHPMH